jgi:hypothetical protein
LRFCAFVIKLNAPNEDNYSIMKSQLQNFLKKTIGILGVRFNLAQISPVLVSTSNRNQAPLKAIKSAE